MPLAIASLTCFFGLLAVGTGALVTAERAATALERSQKTTEAALRVSQSIIETHQFTSDVLAMTHMVTDAEARAGFYLRLRREMASLDTLKGMATDPLLAARVEALTVAILQWVDHAEILMGFESAAAIPTFWQLEESARAVDDQTKGIVTLSRNQAAAQVQSVPASIRSGVLWVSLLAATAAAGALFFASKLSNRISNAMRSVAQSLQELAHIGPEPAGTRRGEISTMFAALSDLRSSVHERDRIAEELEREKDRAEEAARTKSRFLANMSHEIRTPINGILGMAEILESTGLSAEQKECSRTILSSSEALLSVINAILDFSKNEAGEISLHDEPFSLEEVVFDVALLLGPSIGGKDVEVCVDYASDVPKHFIGDAARLRQVVMNLVGNAVKFTPSGHVTIKVTYEKGAELPLRICVQDTGVGIPEDKLDAVFMAFQQVDMQSTRQFNGTGLGLAITQQLVTLFGGDIAVTSQLGDGATFMVSLPLMPTTKRPDTAATPVRGLDDLAGKTALVVDDLVLNREILKRRLERWGMTVHLFSGAPQVIAALSSDAGFAQSIDIGILDYNMPDASGVQLARTLKDREISASFPVILYSSSDSVADEQTTKEAGIVATLLKPARAEVMGDALLRALGLSDGGQKRIPPSSANTPDLTGRRILIAEDNRTNQLVVRRMLEKTGANLIFADNGKLALETYQAHGADLVFMDMSMPVMDGLSATKHIRDHEQKSEATPVPIVALTANALEEDRDACKAAGMTGFLSKPVRKRELLAQLAALTVPTPRQNATKSG